MFGKKGASVKLQKFVCYLICQVSWSLINVNLNCLYFFSRATFQINKKNVVINMIYISEILEAKIKN